MQYQDVKEPMDLTEQEKELVYFMRHGDEKTVFALRLMMLAFVEEKEQEAQLEEIKKEHSESDIKNSIALLRNAQSKIRAEGNEGTAIIIEAVITMISNNLKGSSVAFSTKPKGSRQSNNKP